MRDHIDDAAVPRSHGPLPLDVRAQRLAFLEAVEQSAVGSPFVSAKVSALADRDYTPTASLALMLKDLDLALAAGGGIEQRLPVTELARNLYARCHDRGWAERDFACLAELYDSPAELP